MTGAFRRMLAMMQGRSGRWPALRAAHLRSEPDCQVCGARRDLDVHHVVPFDRDPDAELDPANLLTLCRPHHLLVGHLMSWRSYNPDVRADAAAWRQKLAERPGPA